MGQPARPAVLIIRKDLDTEEEEHVRRQRMLGSDRTFGASSGWELYNKSHVTVDWTPRPIFMPPRGAPSVAPPSQVVQLPHASVSANTNTNANASASANANANANANRGRGGGGGEVVVPTSRQANGEEAVLSLFQPELAFRQPLRPPTAAKQPTLAGLQGRGSLEKNGGGKKVARVAPEEEEVRLRGASAIAVAEPGAEGRASTGSGWNDKAAAGSGTVGGGGVSLLSATTRGLSVTSSGMYDTHDHVAAIRAHLASGSARAIADAPSPSSAITVGAVRTELVRQALPELRELETAGSQGSDVPPPPFDTEPGFFSSLIQLIGQAVIGEELVVDNVTDFNHLQWQRTETVEQADGSSKKFVEVIPGSENSARYRVTPQDEGCCIRIVVSSRATKGEVYGRDTPVVTAPRRRSRMFDLDESSKLSLNVLISVGDGRRVSKNANRSTKRIRRRMGISAKRKSQAEKDAIFSETSGRFGGVVVIHEQSQIDFLSSALGKHFLFTSVTLNTIEEVCRSMKYIQIPAGSNIIEQGTNGDSFYVVDSGEFKVIMKMEGHDQVKVLNTLRRGQCFGESVLMTRSMRRMATVRAVVDCGAWVIHRRVYEEQVLAKSAGSATEEFLKGVDVFYRLAPAVVRGIAARCESVELPADTVIFQQGDLSDDMYFIVGGRVAVIDDDGRELAALTTRDAFGEGAILAGKSRRTATVITRTVTSLLRLPSAIIVKLFPLGLEDLLDEKLVLQVLKSIPGFAQLTEQMLRDCGVTEDSHLQDAVLRSITLEPRALVAEECKPAEAIFIVKRGGLMVTTRRQQKMRAQPRKLSERAYFGTTAAIADGTYHESASATEELTQVLRLPATHVRMLRDTCALAAREDLLKKVPLLSTPSALPLLKSLAADSSIATFDEGTVIMGNGQQNDDDNFFLIDSGFANMYRTDPYTGKVRISARLGVGDYFGERVLLEPLPSGPSVGPGVHIGGTAHTETVVAITDVHCVILSRSAFDAHMGALRGSMLMELEAMVAGGDVGGRPDGAGTGTVAKGAALLMPMSRICQTDLVVHRTLGMGRFGRVRLVQHKITGTTYALKMMGRRLVVEAGQESHVRNEVTVMKRISHPFCTSLFATFVDSRYFYMLLEVTSGGELFRVLEQAPEGRLSNAASCFYAANVVCAFEYLHKQKIIYRDLKPENLMVDAHGFLKIVDFGFAKRVFGRTYTLCGTVDYLAPETVSQQGHGFEVDLWALGVLAYEMLVGCPPFEGENKGDTNATYNNILTGNYTVPPGALAPEASNFIGGLLIVDCLTRLGCGRTGMRDVKMHPWFDGLDWGMLLERRVRPPLTPDISNPLDTQNFDKYDEHDNDIDEFEQPLDALDELFINY